MLRIIDWLKKEIAMLIPAILYFLICFSILHFAQTLLMRPEGIHYTNYTGAIIGAILAGKVILIAENISFINSFSQKPLAYTIAWKFFIYSFFVVFIQIIEHFMHKFFATDSWTLSYEHMVQDLSQSMFWGVQILVLTIFFIFTVFHELINAVGRAKMRKLFFG